MRKLLLITLFIIVIAAIAWWIISTFKKSPPTTKITPVEISQPLVTEPSPDTTDALLQDNLDEALQDIKALE